MALAPTNKREADAMALKLFCLLAFLLQHGPQFQRLERCVVGVLGGRRRYFKRSDSIVVPHQRRPKPTPY